MLWLCFKLTLYIFGRTRDTSVFYGKAKYVCLIYMQPHTVKFTSVQINVKQVSYTSIVLSVLASSAVILPRKRALVALLNLRSCCRVDGYPCVVVGWSVVCNCGVSCI